MERHAKFFIQIFFVKHVGKIVIYVAKCSLLRLLKNHDFWFCKTRAPNFTLNFILILLPSEYILITDIASIRKSVKDKIVLSYKYNSFSGIFSFIRFYSTVN